TQAPLIVGDTVVAPGAFRVKVARPGAEKFELLVEGAGTAVEAGGDGGHAPAALGQAEAPHGKIGISLAPAQEQPDAELRAVALLVQFGSPQLTVPMTIVGTQPLKVKGFAALDVWKLPEAWLAKRLKEKKHSPVATLVRSGKVSNRESDRLNLM